MEVWKSQEYFVYFKIFKPISWGKSPAERRSRLIQRFLIFDAKRGCQAAPFAVPA